MSMKKGSRLSVPGRASDALTLPATSLIDTPTTRRGFLRQSAYLAGLAATVPAVLSAITACHSEPVAPGTNATIDFSSDTGALNFCYALAQLEADMYYRVRSYPYAGMLTTERNTLTSYFSSTYAEISKIKKMSIKHITDSILFDYSTVNFTDRTSSLTMVHTIADAAANGYAAALARVTDPDNQTLIAGWVTAAASRATAIRAMLELGAFTQTTTDPSAVLDILDPYYTTAITLRNTGVSA